MSGIDLSTVGDVAAREDAGQVVHLRDAGGEPIYTGEKQDQPVTITVAGTYSTRFRRAQDQLQQRMLKKRQRDLTPELVTANRIELVAAAILEWQGISDKGQPLPCTKDNAIRLLTAAPWIREQLEEAQQDHAGFTRTASRS